MNIGHVQRRIALYVIVPGILVYFGLRFHAQFRHVDVFVSRSAPMPAQLATGLHMEEHKIDPVVTIESPYEYAPDRMLLPEEIRHLRTSIAWSSTMPAFIDALVIQSPTHVTARRSTKRFIQEYQLVKQGEQWVIKSATKRNTLLRSE